MCFIRVDYGRGGSVGGYFDSSPLRCHAGRPNSRAPFGGRLSMGRCATHGYGSASIRDGDSLLWERRHLQNFWSREVCGETLSVWIGVLQSLGLHPKNIDVVQVQMRMGRSDQRGLRPTSGPLRGRGFSGGTSGASGDDPGLRFFDPLRGRFGGCHPVLRCRAEGSRTR